MRIVGATRLTGFRAVDGTPGKDSGRRSVQISTFSDDRQHNEANYFEHHAKRIRYPQFRSQNLFVGSGVIEAGGKTVIGSRAKRSGMFWSVRVSADIKHPQNCRFCS
jgi:hypothetical protein